MYNVQKLLIINGGVKESVLFQRKDLEENSEELIRIKECYVQLGEESRGLEQKLREEFEKEKQLLLSEVRGVVQGSFCISRSR